HGFILRVSVLGEPPRLAKLLGICIDVSAELYVSFWFHYHHHISPYHFLFFECI
ncbi:hypothetical protein BgiBS90_029619, partial [Biomphalaria glabrata]